MFSPMSLRYVYGRSVLMNLILSLREAIELITLPVYLQHSMNTPIDMRLISALK